MWKKAKASKTCYLFILPYFLLFFVCFILPIAMSLFLSFTYFNVLEAPEWRGMQNYINLILADDVFLTAVKNTFVLAGIIGPVAHATKPEHTLAVHTRQSIMGGHDNKRTIPHGPRNRHRTPNTDKRGRGL